MIWENNFDWSAWIYESLEYNSSCQKILTIQIQAFGQPENFDRAIHLSVSRGAGVNIVVIFTEIL